jgi:hypothetical protein
MKKLRFTRGVNIFMLKKCQWLSALRGIISFVKGWKHWTCVRCYATWPSKMAVGISVGKIHSIPYKDYLCQHLVPKMLTPEHKHEWLLLKTCSLWFIKMFFLEQHNHPFSN